MLESTQIQNFRIIRLEFHDENANSHKYYKIENCDEDMFLCSWGRIGNVNQSNIYIIYKASKASKKLAEKLKKGYKIVSIKKFEENI